VAGLLLAAAGGAAPARAAQAFSAAAPADTLTVGDRLRVEVEARLPDGAQALAAVPGFERDLPEGVRLVGADTLSLAADGRLRGALRLAVFRPGRLELPGLVLPWTGGDGSPADTLRARMPPVVVASVLPAPPAVPALRDIKDLAPLAGEPRLWPWLLAAAVAAAALAAWLWRRRRRPRAAAAAVRAAPPRTPYERALERLEALARARLPEAGRVEEHYEAAADVLRGCLEEAEGIPALERTTSELAWALPPLLSSDGGRDACRELLTEADLVKFARERPDPRRAHAWLEELRGLLAGWQRARRLEEARLLEEEARLAAAAGPADGAPAEGG
jgi:hypothetical protein